jgi:hypothetical protein
MPPGALELADQRGKGRLPVRGAARIAPDEKPNLPVDHLAHPVFPGLRDERHETIGDGRDAVGLQVRRSSRRRPATRTRCADLRAAAACCERRAMRNDCLLRRLVVDFEACQRQRGSAGETQQRGRRPIGQAHIAERPSRDNGLLARQSRCDRQFAARRCVLRIGLAVEIDRPGRPPPKSLCRDCRPSPRRAPPRDCPVW